MEQSLTRSDFLTSNPPHSVPRGNTMGSVRARAHIHPRAQARTVNWALRCNLPRVPGDSLVGAAGLGALVQVLEKSLRCD